MGTLAMGTLAMGTLAMGTLAMGPIAMGTLAMGIKRSDRVFHLPHAPCPMPHAPCPMPHAHYPLSTRVFFLSHILTTLTGELCELPVVLLAYNKRDRLYRALKYKFDLLRQKSLPDGQSAPASARYEF